MAILIIILFYLTNGPLFAFICWAVTMYVYESLTDLELLHE
jgi:hypothetical protein